MSDDPVLTQQPGKSIAQKTSNIPASDLDFLTLAKNVSRAWQAKEYNITLVYATYSQFQQKVDLYESILTARIDEGGKRPGITVRLKNLDKKIDDGITYVRDYIAEKYSNQDATSFYAPYGIVKENNSWCIPRDRDNRLKALAMVVNAIAADGFEKKKYGLPFWSDIRDQYAALFEDAGNTDKTIAIKVSDKNVVKNEIKEILNSLISVIKGNFPTTYKSVLRNWGFMKEKY